MCHRVGKEDEMEFSGESIICDLNGKTISLGGHKEEIVYGEVNLD